MTLDQMETVIELVSVLWPNPKQDMKRLTAGYTLMLASEPYMEVEAAIRSLSESGREWPPPPGVVAKKITQARNSRMLAEVLDQVRERRELGA